MVQLRYFAVGPPALIAIPGFEQVCVREFLETTRCVESRGELVGYCLIMDKAVAVRRADGLLVKLLGLEHAAFDPGNLRTQQRGAVFEILWAILCPYLELLLVSGHSLEMLQIVSCSITRCSSRERTVKVILRHFEEGGRGPE